MSLNVFAKPKKMACEEWLNVIADTVYRVYGFETAVNDDLVEMRDAIKASLYSSAKGDGTVTYKKFIEELGKYEDPTRQREDYGQQLSGKICPVMLKKNNWTTFFDDPEGKPLEGLSTRALRIALKSAYDEQFITLICTLWVRVNIPELSIAVGII